MKQILCFGDSNTYGLIPGTDRRYGWKDRWTGILQEQVKEKGYRVIEEGLCGRTTVFEDSLRAGRRGSTLLPVILESHKPLDTVILMLGTNDCKTVYDASAGVIGLGIKELLKQIKTSDSRTKVLLISPILLGKDIWNGFDEEFNETSVSVSEKLKEVYRKIAEDENIHFMAAADYATASEKDREHLDKKGHKALAKAIINNLAEIL